MSHVEQVRSDFDLIADLPEDPANNNSRYHRLILSQLPRNGEAVLDVGCGKGELARSLAAYFGRVVGIDLSSRMIQKAASAAASLPNITFDQVDLRQWDAQPNSFDAIVSVATLHHLPLADSLPRFASWLRPGGTLVVVDLMKVENFADFSSAALAILLGYAERVWFWHWPSEREKQLWEEHGRRDRYLTLRQARREYEHFLPGTQVRRLLFYRYIATWHKPP